MAWVNFHKLIKTFDFAISNRSRKVTRFVFANQHTKSCGKLSFFCCCIATYSWLGSVSRKITAEQVNVTALIENLWQKQLFRKGLSSGCYWKPPAHGGTSRGPRRTPSATLHSLLWNEALNGKGLPNNAK